MCRYLQLQPQAQHALKLIWALLQTLRVVHAKQYRLVPHCVCTLSVNVKSIVIFIGFDWAGKSWGKLEDSPIARSQHQLHYSEYWGSRDQVYLPARWLASVVLKSTWLPFQKVPKHFPRPERISYIWWQSLKNAWSSMPAFPIHFHGLRLNMGMTVNLWQGVKRGDSVGLHQDKLF